MSDLILREGFSVQSYAEDGGCLMRAWLTRHESEHTRRAYRTDLEQFFESLRGEKPSRVTVAMATAVSSMHVDAHLELMKRAGQPVTSRRRRLTAVRGFFKWCLAHDLIGKNPADPELIRKMPSEEDLPPVVSLSRAQARRLIEAAEHPRDRALVVCGVYLALRRSELAGMRGEHFGERSGHNVLLLPDRKGGRRGYVKVPPVVLKEVSRWKPLPFSGPVWTSLSNRNYGEAISPKSIYRIVKKVVAAAGLGDATTHSLRHTSCTLAIEGGASIYQVKDHAGHKSINTTMRYIHQAERLEDNAVDYVKL